MIEFKTEKGEFLVVDVDKIQSQDRLPSYHLMYGVEFILFGYKVLNYGKLSKFTEEDAKLVVDETVWNFEDGSETHYRNYETESELDFTEIFLPTAIESLYSLLTSKGIDLNNGNWHLFKKLK